EADGLPAFAQLHGQPGRLRCRPRDARNLPRRGRYRPQPGPRASHRRGARAAGRPSARRRGASDRHDRGSGIREKPRDRRALRLARAARDCRLPVRARPGRLAPARRQRHLPDAALRHHTGGDRLARGRRPRRPGCGVRLIRVHTEAALAEGARVTLRGPAEAHVTRVLRLGAGDAVTLFPGDGMDYPARIAALRHGSVDAEVTGRTAARAESPLAMTLVQGIARAERMDLVVQKATELGVAAIVPVATARSVVKLDADSRDRKTAHWRGIAVAA